MGQAGPGPADAGNQPLPVIGFRMPVLRPETGFKTCCKEPMGIYKHVVLPKLMHQICSHKDITGQRRKIIPLAQGRVLEIGIGSGLNLPFYNPRRVTHLWGLDPCRPLLAMAEKSFISQPFPIDFLAESGERIPLDTHSADTVVVTYTLCSIPDITRALMEMRRVLKPGGTLLFSEHGRSPDPGIHKWQDRLTPFWKPVSGGCHLNRPIAGLITNSGFTITRLEAEYLSPLKITGFHYRGSATTG
jgi:SAM-dependent methyltransferase